MAGEISYVELESDGTEQISLDESIEGDYLIEIVSYEKVVS